MKKVFALSVAALFCLAVVALAGDEKMKGSAMEAKIVKVDTAGKMMTVKDSAGKETTIYWNDSTKVSGEELKEGATVQYRASEKDGKMWASWVHVGEMKHKM